jgi:AcrR family transcriptional regulator
MTKASPAASARSHQTRSAIVRAMAELAAHHRLGAIRIDAIAAQAGVGRSTFYDHFHSKDEVVVALFDPILLHLANCASGRLPQAALRQMTDHLWAGRHRLRPLLDSAAAKPLHRKLAGLIDDRRQRGGGEAKPLLAAATASGQLAMLRAWLAGDHPAEPDVFASDLAAFSATPPPARTG